MRKISEQEKCKLVNTLLQILLLEYRYYHDGPPTEIVCDFVSQGQGHLGTNTPENSGPIVYQTKISCHETGLTNLHACTQICQLHIYSNKATLFSFKYHREIRRNIKGRKFPTALRFRAGL